MFVRFIAWLLKLRMLRMEDRLLLITAILDKLAALPLRDIIVANEDGSIFVNGKQLDKESVIAFRESARLSLTSFAERTIEDQVLFRALSFGVNTSVNLEQLYFSKAAVWWGQERHKLLKTLASMSHEQEPTL